MPADRDSTKTLFALESENRSLSGRINHLIFEMEQMQEENKALQKQLEFKQDYEIKE